MLLSAGGCRLTMRTDVERVDGVAAIAIRDHVPEYQKWGTKKFSLEFLEPAYAHTRYFTEHHRGAEHRAFVVALRGALERYQAVDIFLLAHSNRYIEWVGEIEPELRAKIRLVYNTGCADAEQGSEWLALGAKTYVAHGGANIAPIFYYYFLPDWARGTELGAAVADANARTRADIYEGPTSWI